MFSFNFYQLPKQERTISEALLHLLGNYGPRHCVLHIIYTVYMINTSQNLAQKKPYEELVVFFTPKHKYITPHIDLFAKAARKLREKSNDQSQGSAVLLLYFR